MKTIKALALMLVLILSSAFAPIMAQPPKQEFSKVGPGFDQWEVKFIPDYAIQLLTFEAGEIDWVGVLPRDLDRIKNSKPVKDWGGEIVRTQTYVITAMLWFNTRERFGNMGFPWDPDTTTPYNPVGHPAVRKAFAHIFDRDKIIFGPILQGQAVRHSRFLPDIYGAWVNPDADYDVLYPFSLEKAAKLLEDAGFKLAPDGVRYFTVPEKDSFGFPFPDGGQRKPLEIELMVFSEALAPVYWQTAQMLKENAEKIGIKIKLTVTDPLSQSARVLGSRNFQAVIWGWGLGIYPTILRHFQSAADGWDKDRRPRSPFIGGFYGTRNAELDKWIKVFEETNDRDEAIQAAHKAQAILADIVPWVGNYQPVAFTAVSGKVKGLVKSFAPPSTDPVGINTHFSFLNLDLVDVETKKPVTFGATFRDAMSLIPGTLNPMTFVFVGENYVLSRVYEFSSWLDPNDIYGPSIKSLIESWSKEAVRVGETDGTKFTVKVKPGLVWQDGAPITAHDWKFSIDVAGREWQTLRYGVQIFVRNLVEAKLVDTYTIEIVTATKGWLLDDEIDSYRPVPRHIFSRIADPFADVSRTPHPERTDLTAMVGNGPFIMERHETGRLVNLVWSPLYHFANPKKSLSIQLTAPGSIEEGKPVLVNAKITDYLGRAASGALVKVELKGPATAKLNMEHKGEGVFSASLVPATRGDYTLEVKATAPISLGRVQASLQGSASVKLNVRALGTPPPPEAPAVGERPPTPISLPPVPTLPSAEQLPASPSVQGTSVIGLQLVGAIIVLALGLFVARRRGP